ncbi:hypothetical protein TcasGA2_TC005958 [Tribolium castaneum]|uniref:Uncharacterized protein n=1 Tax=Tribolium castaneum TaxID=7070 RepID=D6WVB9_TRICA|nr:hypothetical protein TcasGA2_TC005958 [Tribolium castaneum]
MKSTAARTTPTRLYPENFAAELHLSLLQVKQSISSMSPSMFEKKLNVLATALQAPPRFGIHPRATYSLPSLAGKGLGLSYSWQKLNIPTFCNKLDTLLGDPPGEDARLVVTVYGVVGEAGETVVAEFALAGVAFVASQSQS